MAFIGLMRVNGAQVVINVEHVVVVHPQPNGSRIVMSTGDLIDVVTSLSELRDLLESLDPERLE